MTLEQPGAQYDDSQQKKAKLEVNMGFASSSSNEAVAAAAVAAAAAAAEEDTGETFANQSEQAHGSTSASNWHHQQPAHHQAHHAQAYAASQYPNGFFHQVL